METSTPLSPFCRPDLSLRLSHEGEKGNNFSMLESESESEVSQSCRTLCDPMD